MTKPIIKLEVGNCCPVAFGPIYRTSTVSNRILLESNQKAIFYHKRRGFGISMA